MSGYSTHCFSVELATKIGLRETIILQHLFWWHQNNSGKEEMNIDGRVWFFLNKQKVAEVFPYFTESAVRTTLEKLIAEGYLMKDHKGEGQQKFNRTNWYALTNRGISLFHLQKSTNGDEEISESIVNKEIVNNKVNNNNPLNNIPLAFESAKFGEVWATLCRQPKWKGKSRDALQAQMDFLAGYPERDAIKIMQNSIRNGWQGLFPLKAGESDTKAQYELLVRKVGSVHASIYRQGKEMGWTREDVVQRCGESYAKEWDEFQDIIQAL